MKIRYKIFLVILILLFIDSYGQKSNTYNHLTESEIEWLNQNKNSIKYAPNPFWPPMDYIDENGDHQGLISDYIKFFEKE